MSLHPSGRHAGSIPHDREGRPAPTSSLRVIRPFATPLTHGNLWLFAKGQMNSLLSGPNPGEANDNGGLRHGVSRRSWGFGRITVTMLESTRARPVPVGLTQDGLRRTRATHSACRIGPGARSAGPSPRVRVRRARPALSPHPHGRLRAGLDRGPRRLPEWARAAGPQSACGLLHRRARAAQLRLSQAGLRRAFPRPQDASGTEHGRPRRGAACESDVEAVGVRAVGGDGTGVLRQRRRP